MPRWPTSTPSILTGWLPPTARSGTAFWTFARTATGLRWGGDLSGFPDGARRSALRSRGKGCQHGRQFDAENRAAVLAVEAKNLSVVLLHDAKADAQSEAGAFADRLGGVKRIEDPVRFLDPWPGIGENDGHV